MGLVDKLQQLMKISPARLKSKNGYLDIRFLCV